jgi:hypothetical protein
VHRPEEAKEEDIGTGCGVFKVEKLGDEYFSFIVDCVEPKSCSIILRGASKDVLNEVRGPPTPMHEWTRSHGCFLWLRGTSHRSLSPNVLSGLSVINSVHVESLRYATCRCTHTHTHAQ